MARFITCWHETILWAVIKKKISKHLCFSRVGAAAVENGLLTIQAGGPTTSQRPFQINLWWTTACSCPLFLLPVWQAMTSNRYMTKWGGLRLCGINTTEQHDSQNLLIDIKRLLFRQEKENIMKRSEKEKKKWTKP